MIRITRDELKSSANDNLITVANQITQDIENFYRYTWLSPLKLMKKVVENKKLGAEEKLSLLTEEMMSSADLVAIQVTIEGAATPLLVAQDNFSDQLKKASLDPGQILELTPAQIAAIRKDADVFAGDPRYIAGVDTWLITVILPLDEAVFGRSSTISARINLSRIISHIKKNSFNKIGFITLIEPEGRNIFRGNRSRGNQSELIGIVKKALASDIRTMGTGLSVLPSGEKLLGAYAVTDSLKLGIIVEMMEANAYLAVTRMEENFITWIIFGFSVAAVVALVISVSLTRPLRRLARAARMISKGDFSAASDIDIRSRDEVGMLAKRFIEMSRDLEESYRTLEQKVEERTKALHETLGEVSEANDKIMESIRYAKMIQRSLLPNLDEVKTFIPKSFFIWMPRDIVGGDAFFIDFFDGGFIIAVFDCTGHGIPGAFMTMIASSGLRRIIRDDTCHDPGEILRRLNFIVKTSLQQDTEHALSDDGLDAAICFVRLKDTYFSDFDMIFAGAKLPLAYVHNDEVHVIKGDRKSIGYKRSDLDFTFTNHKIRVEKGMSFYIYSDGFIDQLGGEKGRRFGSKRFRELLRVTSREPFEKQEAILLQAFNEHRGENERQDDLTVVGFGF
ncbi:SpoIIE family protein phosphatase [Desulfobacterales bacterium HSG2]|nr:SpoIIE family protein phosphatase [Desulfobacterales bacterium HSG2]